MIIDAIDIFLVKSPLISPWRTAYGEDSDIYSIIVGMHSGAYTGWSEASPLFAPTYSPEYADGVYHVAKEFLAPRIVGRAFESADQINELFSVFKGNSFAKSALEIAWWTLEADRLNVPLHSLLGGVNKIVPAGADFGVQNSYDELIELIGAAIDAGYPRVKLKVMRGWDLEMLQAVRSTFSNFTFHIDCNGGFTLDDLPLLKEIDRLDLAMIEQPLYFNDIVDHAKLQSAIETPICLDESLSEPRIAEQALELGSCRYMNLKPGRLGGISKTLAVNKMCEEAGVGCWFGSMLETGIGAGILIELSTISNQTYPGDLFPSDRFYETELSSKRIELEGPGYFLPSELPGTPYTPDMQVLNARTIKSARIEP